MNLAEPAIKHILSKWTEWRPLKRMLSAFFFQHTAGFHFALGYKMDIFFLQICIVQNKARVP